MRPREAEYLGSLLDRLANGQISPALNLGSSTALFEDERPHIDAHVFRPLRKREVRVVNMDLKSAPGVDIVGDIYDRSVQETVRAVGAKLLICCNVLEHVTQPKEFARICGSLLDESGMILVSVPFSYPYHLDPIDTYLRPTPEQIAALFDGFELVEGRIVTDLTYLDDLRRENGPKQLARYFAAHAAKFFLPFAHFDAWKARYHRYLWLFRPYRVSCALLRRTATTH